MTGKDIRNFFRDLLGSRLVARLEEDLLRLRQDFEDRLKDKDIIVANLREENQQLKQKVAIYELTIMPRASVQGAEVVGYSKPTKPSFSKEMFLEPPPISRWAQVQQEHEANLKREAEEESAAKQKA